MEISKIDEKGRLLIPKRVRVEAGLKKGNPVRVEARGKSIIVEPLEPVAEKYFGVFKVAKWPDDLDKFIEEVTKEWWKQKAM